MKNCSFSNQSLHSIEVQCTAGYDGGLPQVFVLELISSRTGAVRFNMTNSEEPYFVIESLDALVQQQQQQHHQTAAAASSASAASSSSSSTIVVDGSGSILHHDHDDRKSAAAAISRTTTTTISGSGVSTIGGTLGVMSGGGPPERAFKAVVFAVNQKGRSPRLVLKEFMIGDAGRSDESEFFC